MLLSNIEEGKEVEFSVLPMMSKDCRSVVKLIVSSTYCAVKIEIEKTVYKA